MRTSLTLQLLVTISAAGCYASAPRGEIGRAPNAGQQDEQLMAAAIDTIATHWTDSSTICLSVMSTAPRPTAADDQLLRRIRTRRAVPPARCPKTYTTMLVVVDSLGRPTNLAPAGYVDPHILTVGRPQYGQPGYGWVHVRESHGTTSRVYLCTVQQYDGPATASCRQVEQSIS